MDDHPPCPPAAAAAGSPDKQIEEAPSFLTLGDGDFSYSLDLCRFLASTTQHDAAIATTNSRVAAHVTCSGIDSSDEVRAKYRDADSIIRKIISLDERQVIKRREKKRRKHMKKLKRKRDDDEQAVDVEGTCSLLAEVDPSPLSVRVEHGVNAIVMPGSEPTHSSIKRCQHVIFNHPHIGTESAALHRRFLSHLFHTVDQHWLAPNGVFHLTLILGQADRWNCLDAATKHGFTLLNRDTFRPPPPPPSKSSIGTETYFKSRRHQSGRSFANRSTGSETLTFGRICDEKEGHVARHLPWQNMPNVEESGDNMLKCPHCPRSFRDERARKNHIKCSHPNGGDGASQAITSATSVGETLPCQYCNISAFTSAQALSDHVKAKHSGKHTDIKPEWSKAAASSGHRKEGEMGEDTDIHTPTREAIGSCDICGLSYYSPEDEAAHLVEFVPQPVVVRKGESMAEAKRYKCLHCDKSFKDTRAVRQHENFCSKRPDVSNAATK